MQIRPYDPTHLDAVVRLSLRAWAPVFESLREILDRDVYEAFYPDWRTEQAQAVAAACSSKDMAVWVAIDSGPAVGFVAVKLHTESKMGEIHMIAVDPDTQRRGVASALTALALDHMKAAGMSVAMVETGGDPGHAPARSLYERSGFRLFPVARYFRKL
jgi:ribosomal protein S18 acetylase RimI-like enzyme